MKKLIFVFAAGLLLAAAAAVPAQLKRTTTKTDKFDFGAGGTVTLVGAPVGSVKITSSSRNEIEITAEIEVQAATDADLSAMASVTGFALQEGMTAVSILSVGPNDNKNARKADRKLLKKLSGLAYRIDYIVSVPRYCDLTVNVGKGSLSVSGVEGTFRINALESDVTLDLVGGGLSATVGKGSLSMTMPNRSWRGSAIDAAVTSGTLNATLPTNLSAEIDASVLRTGAIENGLRDLKPKDRNVPITAKTVAAKAGAGGVSIKLTVGDGTIKLIPAVK